MKRWLSIIILLSVMAIFAEVNCQTVESEAEPVIFTTKGSVSGVNWVADKIVVRTFVYGVTDEITFIVSNSTAITRGSSTIPFSNINIGDNVTVSYYSSFAGLKAVRIVVKQ